MGDQGVEVDLMDVEGVTVDAGMSPIGEEVEIEVVAQALHDPVTLRLVMFVESEII